MKAVNLIDFIKNGEIFEKIEGKYLQIVSDYDFGDLENFIKIDDFGDFQKIDKDKKTLLILDKLLYVNVDFLINMVDLTILDLNFGMDSLRFKLGFSNTSISYFVKKNIAVYEPADLISLINILSMDNQKYVRVANIDVAENLMNMVEYRDIFDLSDKGYDGGNISVVTTASLLSEVLRMLSLLGEENLSISMFVLNKLNLDFSKIKFLSKNIVFIIDMEKDLDYENMLNEQLKGFNIKFIYPNYGNNSGCVLDEYKYENYCFDAQSLLDTILKR